MPVPVRLRRDGAGRLGAPLARQLELLAMSVILIATVAVLIVAVIDPTSLCEGRGRFGWLALLIAPFGVTFLTIGMPTMVRLTIRDRDRRRRHDA